MSNLKNIVDLASSGNFVKFEKAVQAEINNRLNNNPTYQQHRQKVDKYNSVMNKFKEISQEIRGGN